MSSLVLSNLTQCFKLLWVDFPFVYFAPSACVLWWTLSLIGIDLLLSWPSSLLPNKRGAVRSVPLSAGKEDHALCYFSHSLFLCLFALPPTVCSHFIKSGGNSTGSHCWGSTPIRCLLSSQISHVLAFKC